MRLVWLEGGRERLLADPSEIDPDDPLAGAVEAALASDRGGLVETAKGPVFVHPHNP